MLHELLDSRRLRHTGLHGIDPRVTRGSKSKQVTQLALQHVSVVHHVAVIADNRRFDDIHVRIGQAPNALGIGQVLVDFADKLVLVVEQEGLGAIKERQVHVGEHFDRAREFTDGEM